MLWLWILSLQNFGFALTEMSLRQLAFFYLPLTFPWLLLGQCQGGSLTNQMLISKCNFIYGLKVARCLQWHIKGVLDTSVRVSHWCRDNGGRLFKICWEGESLHQYMWKTWELQRSDSLEGFQWSFNWKLIKAQWLTSVSEIVLSIMTQSWSWGSQISDKKMKHRY